MDINNSDFDNFQLTPFLSGIDNCQEQETVDETVDTHLVELESESAEPSYNKRTKVTSKDNELSTEINQTSKKSSTKRPKRPRPCDRCRERRVKCTVDPQSNNCSKCDLRGLKCVYSEESNHVVVDELHPPPLYPIKEINPLDYLDFLVDEYSYKSSLSFNFNTNNFLVGPTSIYDINLLNNRKNSSCKVATDGKVFRNVGNKIFFSSKKTNLDKKNRAYLDQISDSDAIERFVAPYGHILNDIFFRVINPALPIIEKKIYLDKYSRSHREIHPVLLSTLYLNAIKWWDSDSRLNFKQKPNITALTNLALKTYHDSLVTPNLEVIQAGILLIHGKIVPSRQLTINNEIIVILQNIGLFANCSDWDIPEWEKHLRKRVSWALYSQNQWICLSLSNTFNPIFPNDEYWLLQSLNELNFIEESNDIDNHTTSYTDITQGRVLFIKFVALSKILANVLDLCYQSIDISRQETIDKFQDKSNELVQNLKDWKSTSAAERLSNILENKRMNSNGYLMLAYYCIQVTLRKLYLTKLNYLIPPKSIASYRKELKKDLLDAIDFVRNLQPEHLNAFWHFSSTYSFIMIGVFAAMMLTTSDTDEEKEEYTSICLEYKWVLRLRSKGYYKISEAVDNLESIYSLVDL